MPLFSRVSIRISLVYFLTGSLAGSALLVSKALNFPLWQALSAHIEIMIFGWLFQFIMGVSFWILPRMKKNSRGWPGFVWISTGLLNAGVLLFILSDINKIFRLTGMTFEALALVFYVRSILPRLRYVKNWGSGDKRG